jgi:ornithine decarboxylase
MTATVRHIEDDDWAAVAELETGAYATSGLSEGRSLLESRGRASPATSFVLDTGEAIAGYLLALPYPSFRYPDLARPELLACQSPNLHLHDLVIGAEFRGTGLARYLLQHLTERARSQKYERISLVAVAGSAGFWSARGYHPHSQVTPPPGYGVGAVYMSREIDAAAP